MSDIPENQISDWLKKLERESWQLELLVSAFTIFLLIQGGEAFNEFLRDLDYEYNVRGAITSIIYIFLGLISVSLRALTICLVTHLLLRGFWIGAIGLRSVQSNVDFSRLNYNPFFTSKLKEKMITLDQLVIKLDEICSVVFAFAFLVISMILSFGLYLISLGIVGAILSTIDSMLPESLDSASTVFGMSVLFIYILTGVIYLIDYFTLGFFKKIKWFRKAYYPIYRFYSLITFSTLSRSIYYYLISKFTKKRIRILYGVLGGYFLYIILFSFDQNQYYPKADNGFQVSVNNYDNLRPEDDYIETASINSDYIDRPYLQLFLRYAPVDNSIISNQCPDFEPVSDDGLNWRLRANIDETGFQIQGRDHSNENFDSLLLCHSCIYEISINDSVYNDLNFYFYEHPAKDQKGLLTNIPAESFSIGENFLKVRKLTYAAEDSIDFEYEKHALIPFWYEEK